MQILHSKGVREGGAHRVFIAIPSYGGISANTLYSLFGAKEALLRNKIESELEIFAGNCHVDDGRNRLVRDFLEGDCDVFVFIDTDVRFDPEDLVRLVKHDRDVVAGIYPLKQDIEEYPVRFFDGEIWAEEDGLIKVQSVPTGFLKIKRHVLEKLYKTVKKFKVRQDKPHQMKIPLIFERTIEDYTRWGGDYEFCQKWRGLGGEIYIDPEMSFGHIGEFEWTGTLGHHLRQKAGLTKNYIKSKLDLVASGKETEVDFLRLAEAWDNDWSVIPDFLQLTTLLARENEGSVLECGSGITTLVLGTLGKKHGFTVTSLEHDSHWYGVMKGWVDELDLPVNLEYAPIKDYDGFKWYSKIPDGEFSLVLCDGPPRDYGRDGLIYLMKDQIKGTVIKDDAGVLTTWEDALNTKFTIFGTSRPYAVAKVNA